MDLTNTHKQKQFLSNVREVRLREISEDYEIILKDEAIHIVYSDEVYRQIVKILSQNPLIDRIFILRTNNTFSVWTSLKKYDKESRYSLYKQELEIIKYFSPVEFHFDFHMADAQDTKELLTSGARVIFPRN